jgi:hypothetical protein
MFRVALGLKWTEGCPGTLDNPSSPSMAGAMQTGIMGLFGFAVGFLNTTHPDRSRAGTGV